jgi:xanthosine utilization system XapX-like protein
MTKPQQMIAASMAVGVLTALLWFRAPIVPAAVGAGMAGLLLYLRSRRAGA